MLLPSIPFYFYLTRFSFLPSFLFICPSRWPNCSTESVKAPRLVPGLLGESHWLSQYAYFYKQRQLLEIIKSISIRKHLHRAALLTSRGNMWRQPLDGSSVLFLQDWAAAVLLNWVRFVGQMTSCRSILFITEEMKRGWWCHSLPRSFSPCYN